MSAFENFYLNVPVLAFTLDKLVLVLLLEQFRLQLQELPFFHKRLDEAN